MELTARVTADAKVTTLKDERTVINFTIAHNEYYKPKGSTEVKQVTEFIQCAYWLNSKLASRLTKGALVEISGRIGVNAYTTSQGEARANLTCHVHKIKVHSTRPLQEIHRDVIAPPYTQPKEHGNLNTTATRDDLPF